MMEHITEQIAELEKRRAAAFDAMNKAKRETNNLGMLNLMEYGRCSAEIERLGGKLIPLWQQKPAEGRAANIGKGGSDD